MSATNNFDFNSPMILFCFVLSYDGVIEMNKEN